MRRSRTGSTLVATITVAGLLAGCSVGGETKTVTVEQPSADKSSGGSPSPSPSPSPEPGPGGGATPPGGVVAQGEGSADSSRFRFVVTELKRRGPTVVLNARMEYLSGDDDSIQIAETFSDGQRQGGTDVTEDAFSFDGPALIDPEGRRKYLVARDPEGQCVCSHNLSGTFAEKGAPISLEATLSAPPPDVKTVDLVIPNVQTFSNVPLED